ncbi:putative tRNA dimethylallyltransferase [Rosa chinensis]|uniref:Putative tRNA dimethylallyltransferase n=1 Tax=Rosa chinensis TaxID=74649 RepID=A0A2P6PIT4_ROSCH|nr:putative tRNA dimethylallyltransferase [Rosa chinensis]PRQ60896.1 putative tRNA dimethylallyltransferase [Rosa chinensis]
MVSGTDGILSEARWLLDADLIPNSNSATRAIGYRNFIIIQTIILDFFFIRILCTLLYHVMEYLLVCREQGGSSSPREFYNFLTEFQKASR